MTSASKPRAGKTYPDRESIENKANRLGLGCTTWAPGDGVRRYRFHPTIAADYHDGTGIGTVLGRTEAHIWLNGYAAALFAARPVTA